MFEKIGRLAETASNKVSVSRRGFLGRLGQSALGIAGVLTGLNAATAKAGSGSYICCKWTCKNPTRAASVCLFPGSRACWYYNPCLYGWQEHGQKKVSSCTECTNK
jgi:hypothetical protein